MEEEKVKQRWKKYFDDLLNQENPTERTETKTEETKRDVEDVFAEEVRTGLRKMKKGKVQGPDDLPVEVWIALGQGSPTGGPPRCLVRPAEGVSIQI